MSEEDQRRRSEDKGWLTRGWDWIDERNIDKHAVSIVILWGTWRVTEWAMAYAAIEADRTGIEVAAVIAAVMAPYMALQAGALKWYFDARKNGA